MQSLLQNPFEKKEHSCISLNKDLLKPKFCKICGIFINPSSCQSPTEGTIQSETNDEQTLTPTVFPKPEQYYRTSHFDKSLGTKIDHSKNIESMLRKQHHNRFYNSEACHLTVRPQIISFIRRIHSHFNKSREVFYKAVNFMDSVFSTHEMTPQKIEVCVLLCLHLASKFDESFSDYDQEKSFFKFAGRTHRFKTLIFLEEQLIRALDYRMDVQSSFHFLNFFKSRGIITDKDIYGLMGLAQHYTPVDHVNAPTSPIFMANQLEINNFKFLICENIFEIQNDGQKVQIKFETHIFFDLIMFFCLHLFRRIQCSI